MSLSPSSLLFSLDVEEEKEEEEEEDREGRREGLQGLRSVREGAGGERRVIKEGVRGEGLGAGLDRWEE